MTTGIGRRRLPHGVGLAEALEDEVAGAEVDQSIHLDHEVGCAISVQVALNESVAPDLLVAELPGDAGKGTGADEGEVLRARESAVGVGEVEADAVAGIL